ncbi:hypothetical protein TRIP_B330028 [uncultured Desulfatiglans sp.]|uniref:Uncharacterized protein n=1 Tax=Uncultured Desulfatiglans sp. TaxID=1748965 RepID=A0A653A7A5_UNCDX|nr:hypothetical protein TRIP_B330028 [uncultured Desulfatiglans sp.]
MSTAPPASDAFLRDGPWARQRSEHLFPRAADGTFPIIRKILKTGSLGNLPFSIPPVGVVYVPTVYRLTLIHVFWRRHIILLAGVSKPPADHKLRVHFHAASIRIVDLNLRAIFHLAQREASLFPEVLSPRWHRTTVMDCIENAGTVPQSAPAQNN